MSRPTSAASHSRVIGILVAGLGLFLLILAVAFYRDALGIGAMEGSPIWLAATCVGALGLLLGCWLVWRAINVGRILRAGIVGQATILAVHETGQGFGGSDNRGGGTPFTPILRVELRVTLPGHPPYDASVREVVGGLQLLQLRPGLAVTVRAHPRNLTKVVIDWETAAQRL